jgi:hypothetical protein
MSDERRYEPLTQQQRDDLWRDFKIWAEEGYISHKLHESLIGIEPDEYKVGWPDLNGERDLYRKLPPELVSYSYDGIDAYAAALLATETLIAPNCLMTAWCEFKKADDDGVTLRFFSTTDSSVPELFGDRIPPFLTGFIAALESKSMPLKNSMCSDKVKAPAWFRSPGQMVLSKSSLAAIPESKWPIASRNFTVTEQVRAAARRSIMLLTLSAKSTQ